MTSATDGYAAVTTSQRTEARKSASKPYVGPQPIEFGLPLAGRDEEIQALFDALISERIVVLVSPSGAGKTSLINAGLLPRLHEEGFQEWGPFRVNPVPTLAALKGALPSLRTRMPDQRRFVVSVLQQWNGNLPESLRVPPKALATMRFSEFVAYVRKCAHVQLPVLILDQF